VDTSYDALGRISSVSNPYHPGDAMYWTTTSYDALGRATQVTMPGGASTTTSYAGNQTTVTDAAGKKRVMTNDALGRLTQVVEDPAGLNYATTYGYDALDDLVSVTQGSQTRSFVYDSLKRLTSATNPESGTLTYSYDPAGNLVAKSDARGIATAYSYDALNRLKTKSYSDGTPAVSYSYDTGVVKGIGRLTQVANANSVTNYSAYDELGRVTQSNQQTTGQTYGFAYTYNRGGALTSETYPSGRTVTTSYDRVNRPIGMSGVLNGQSKAYASLGRLAARGAEGHSVREWHCARVCLQQPAADEPDVCRFGRRKQSISKRRELRLGSGG